MVEPMSTAALLALIRRLSGKRKSTTLTITRISGDPEAPAHEETVETVVVEAEPVPDTAARRLARAALVVALVAAALGSAAVAGTVLRRERGR
jgi:hypothetical protein